MAQLTFSKKHKIKEDHFIESVFEARQWITDNSKQLSTWALVLLAAIVIGLVFYNSRKSSSTKAQESFGNAMIAYQSNDMENSVTSFKLVLDNYPKTSYAGISSYMLAGIYYNQKNYAMAEEYYNKTINKISSNDLLKGASLRGLGFCAIQEKQYEEAVSFFNKFVKECPENYLMPEVLISLGECYIKQNNSEKAKEALQRIVKDFADSDQNPIAKNLLATL